MTGSKKLKAKAGRFLLWIEETSPVESLQQVITERLRGRPVKSFGLGLLAVLILPLVIRAQENRPLYETSLATVKKMFDQAHGSEIVYKNGERKYLYGHRFNCDSIAFYSRDSFMIRIAESDGPLQPGDDHIESSRYELMHTRVVTSRFSIADVIDVSLDTSIERTSAVGRLKIKLKDTLARCRFEDWATETVMNGTPGTEGSYTSVIAILNSESETVTGEIFLTYSRFDQGNSNDPVIQRSFADLLIRRKNMCRQ